MMWRNSGSFSSTLVSRTRPNSLLSPIVSPYRGHPSGGGGGGGRGGGGILSVLFAPSSSSHLHSSSSGIPSPFDSLKSGLTKPLQSRPFILSSCSSSAAAAALSPSSSISKAARDAADALQHYSRCYWELSKARLSLLVVATSGTGFVLGSGGVIDFAGLCFTCAGTMMVAASANSLNQVFEINNDAKMKRTMQRPLPSGRISVPHAIVWASSVGVAGTTLLAWKANALTAGLAASTLALYAFVYTPLKQIHPINTWVGAVVGAIPPLLGWIRSIPLEIGLFFDHGSGAVPITGSLIIVVLFIGVYTSIILLVWTAAYGQVSLNGMILPAALYFWQIPHFMALAYMCRNDYAAGGFKMFSLADASGQRTALVALRNCLYLLPLGFLAYNWGITSEWFCIESSLFTLFMSAGALSFYWNRTTRNARRMFHASLLYLPVFMSGLLLHRLPNSEHEFTVTDSDTHVSLSFSKSSLEVENTNHQIKPRSNPVGSQARPPVSYASVAPFPFLPAPLYVSPDP